MNNLSNEGAVDAARPHLRPWREALALLVVCVVAAIAVGGASALCSWGWVGMIRDDGIYLLAARALREGYGYIDLSFSNHPGALRYPPGYPIILALATWGAHSVQDEAYRAQWVPLLSLAAFILLNYAFFRLRSPLSGTLALIATIWGAFQHIGLLIASRVLSDVPFAAASMAIVLLFEALWASAEVGAAGWFGMGAAIGLGCLIRYSGVALIAAAALTMALGKRWRGLAALLLGFGFVLLPWVLYRQHIGGSDYVETYSSLLPQTSADWLRGIGLVLAGALGSGIPGMVCGALFIVLGPMHPDLVHFIVGVSISALVITGILANLMRPQPGRSRLPEFYVLTTIAVSMAYGLSFTFYADYFLQRCFVPIIAFLILGAIRGTQVWTAWAPRRLREVILALVILAGVANNALGGLSCTVGFMTPPALAAGHLDLFEHIRRLTPPNAHLIAYEGHMVTLYTDRVCDTLPQMIKKTGAMPAEASPATAVDYMATHHVNYLVGSPDLDMASGRNMNIQLTNAIIKAAPTLLREVYVSPQKNFALYYIDPKLLADADAFLKNLRKAAHLKKR